ncbi:alpha/beta fold hydrolase [Streptomyces sp. NRRL S-481]|uniref:alpha/beta fold hydrolase n=1 Tax=Streptomyces sp. NRRL S-481 TaxID=1463911 RepID=UPI0004CB8582|nr:alpha/beta hydrolase [Streptomyces sp. NRRL S-481]
MPQMSAVDRTHRLVPSPAGRLHLVEQGDGPLVLLLHGFPESWYAWRHQLPALAAAGCRAVAVDVRGYGRSSRPAAVEAYRMLELVEDNVAVVEALGERSAVVVGHDWGATIAATSALVRPDVFRAVGLLSVPYTPPGGPRPSEVFARMGGEEEFYVSYFQRPGRAEAEVEPDVRGWRFPADRLPHWLSEADLDVFAGEFERTGMTGALNRYRNMDRDWEDLADFAGAPIRQPSLFIGGGLDASTTWLAAAIESFPATLPGLTASHILDGCGHFVQQERAAETNRLLIDWLAGLP